MMRTDVIYRFVADPTSHTYVVFNDDGTFREFYSMKRASEARPNADVIVMVTAS
jgi:hypothetical protein